MVVKVAVVIFYIKYMVPKLVANSKDGVGSIAKIMAVWKVSRKYALAVPRHQYGF